VNTYGMVNLVAGKPIVPELIQHQFTAEAVVAEVEPLLKPEGRAGEMRQNLASVRAKLGAPGASGRAAAAILNVAASAKPRS
jgi:lipid-A-disaccharide synthase